MAPSLRINLAFREQDPIFKVSWDFEHTDLHNKVSCTFVILREQFSTVWWQGKGGFQKCLRRNCNTKRITLWPPVLEHTLTGSKFGNCPCFLQGRKSTGLQVLAHVLYCFYYPRTKKSTYVITVFGCCSYDITRYEVKKRKKNSHLWLLLRRHIWEVQKTLFFFFFSFFAGKREVPKVSPLRAPFICGRIWRLFKLKNLSRKMPQISEDTYEINPCLEWNHQNRWMSRLVDPPFGAAARWVRPLNSEDIGLGERGWRWGGRESAGRL